MDHIAFGIKLAEDRVGQPVGFQIGPDFQLVGGQLHEVLCGIVPRGSIQSHAAQPLVSLPQFVVYDVFLLLLLEDGHLFLELPDFGFIGIFHGRVELLAFLLQFRVDAINLFRQGDFGFIIGGPVSFGTLEHHVFQYMRDAGSPLGVVHTSYAKPQIERHGGGLVSLDH